MVLQFPPNLLTIYHDLFHVIRTLFSRIMFNSRVTGQSITEGLHPEQTHGSWGVGWSVALCNSNSSAEHPCTAISFPIIPQAKTVKVIGFQKGCSSFAQGVEVPICGGLADLSI